MNPHLSVTRLAVASWSAPPPATTPTLFAIFHPRTISGFGGQEGGTVVVRREQSLHLFAQSRILIADLPQVAVPFLVGLDLERLVKDALQIRQHHGIRLSSFSPHESVRSSS
jgi:hypothetical protein